VKNGEMSSWSDSRYSLWSLAEKKARLDSLASCFRI